MIRLELPWLPPSANHAYMNNGFGGRTLSKEGRAFLVKTKAHLAQKHPKELMLFKSNTPFLLVFRFFFEGVTTKGFATGKAESRYKKIDVDNRIKLLADALKDAGGIDDSQYFSFVVQKLEGTPERTVIWAWDLEKESTPFDDPLRRLT